MDRQTYAATNIGFVEKDMVVPIEQKPVLIDNSAEIQPEIKPEPKPEIEPEIQPEPIAKSHAPTAEPKPEIQPEQITVPQSHAIAPQAPAEPIEPCDPVSPEPKPVEQKKQKKSHPLVAITCILVLILGVISVLIYTETQEISNKIDNQTLEGNHSMSYSMGFNNGYYQGLFVNNQTEIFMSGYNQCVNEVSREIDDGKLIVRESE